MEITLEAGKRYLRRRLKDYQLLVESIDTKNFCEVEKIGHKLKGNGASFGHQEISSLGQKMENAARNRDLKGLEDAKNEFSKWISEKIN